MGNYDLGDEEGGCRWVDRVRCGKGEQSRAKQIRAFCESKLGNRNVLRSVKDLTLLFTRNTPTGRGDAEG